MLKEKDLETHKTTLWSWFSPSTFTEVRRASLGCQTSTATIFLVPRDVILQNPVAISKKREYNLLWTKGASHLAEN